MKASTIELVWGTWKNFERVEFEFIDYRINGQLLSSILNLDIETGSLIGVLGWERRTVKEHQKRTNMFLLQQPTDLESGRYSLYICPACGDVGCGTITIDIKKTQQYFIWTDFAYERYYNHTMHEFVPYESLGPFYFGLYHYHNSINLYLNDIAYGFRHSPRSG